MAQGISYLALLPGEVLAPAVVDLTQVRKLPPFRRDARTAMRLVANSWACDCSAVLMEHECCLTINMNSRSFQGSESLHYCGFLQVIVSLGKLQTPTVPDLLPARLVYEHSMLEATCIPQPAAMSTAINGTTGTRNRNELIGPGRNTVYRIVANSPNSAAG